MFATKMNTIAAQEIEVKKGGREIYRSTYDLTCTL